MLYPWSRAFCVSWGCATGLDSTEINSYCIYGLVRGRYSLWCDDDNMVDVPMVIHESFIEGYKGD